MMTFGWDGEVNTQDIQKKKSGFVRDKEDSTFNKEAESQRQLTEVNGQLHEVVSRGDNVSKAPLDRLLKYGQHPEKIKVDTRYGGGPGPVSDDNKIQ